MHNLGPYQVFNFECFYWPFWPYSTLSNNRAGWNKLCRMENFQNLIRRAGWNKLCRIENFLTLIKCAGLNKLCTNKQDFFDLN